MMNEAEAGTRGRAKDLPAAFCLFGLRTVAGEN